MSPIRARINTLAERLTSLLPARAGLRALTGLYRWNGQIEPEILHLPKVMKSRRLALDIGSNLGITTTVLAGFFDRVEAFEPNPRLAARTARGLRGRAVVHPVALSDKAGMAELRIPVDEGVTLDGWASLDRPQVGADACWQRVPVETRTLDSFDFVHLDFVKIDVEGHEIAVLQGASETLARHRPWLVVEAWEDHREPVQQMLAALDYRLRPLQELCGHAGSAQNLVFLPHDAILQRP